MDPAQSNPNNPNGQSGTTGAVIQPGQFVVAGEQPQQSPQNTEPAPGPMPSVSLAGERQPAAEMPVTPNAAASGMGSQPDPAPFTPPVTGQAAQNQAQNVQSPAGGEAPKGGKTKIIFVILALLVLAGIVSAVVYFFVLPMMQNKTDDAVVDEQIIETTPSPPSTGSGTGFGEIPESTSTPDDNTTVPNGATEPAPQGETVDPLAVPTQ